MAKSAIPELRIEPIQKGGFIVHHSTPDSGSGPYKAPKKFAFDNHAAMVTHVKKATFPKPTSFKDTMKAMSKTSSASLPGAEE